MMNMKGHALKATEGLSLLGAYEDSDDEDSDSQQTTKMQHNQSADIDSTLANFMAEIDAITTQPNSEDASPHPVAPSPTPPRPENNSQQGTPTKGQEQPCTEADFRYNTQESLAGVGVEMGDWQEVWDDNTGCYYYWSTMTNEVSWELPSYLANQVQGLSQNSNSTTVNGNATVETEYYLDTNTAVANTPVIKKEAKEVMESVEVENGVGSDGETGGLAGSPSPSASLRDSEGLPATQKEPRSNNQSQDNSDADEEPEEDTMELELALERKKAELRALEEGDGSAGGSSPYSETSQEASQGAAMKKSRWKTAFMRAASPDSNSRGSDTQEHVETVQLKSPEKLPEVEETDADKAEDKSAVKVLTKEVEVETPELRTRIADWREGALNGVYLRRRLQEAAQHIKHYELNATPKGWSCHWDSIHYVPSDRPYRTSTVLAPLPAPVAASVEMEMDDEEPGEPPAPGTEEDGSGRPAPPPPVTTRVHDSSVSTGRGQKRKASQLNKSITIGSGAILYTQNPVSAASVMTTNPYWGVSTVSAPSIPADIVAPPPPAPPVQPPLPLSQPPPEPSAAKALPSDKNKKPKKDKSKKIKTKMPSLVKKWQSIQKELDEEDKSSSSEEDRDQSNKRTIEEWKHQQVLTGKSNTSANFQALPADWRERLKKRKKTTS
ncbi:hypothetical protein NHX12_002992 [Muraenolepis orangiensis]|uniref:WW domain-containing protein n=1 Tax=Muraenolepis orangiensis TaxID=630683 RepID=A0A9Q0DXN0_9TELE|nr:hypothetical protein NHX12_002992 [Muraenolepis orangiensis]